MLQSVSRVQRSGRNPTCGDWVLEANQLLSQNPEGNWSPNLILSFLNHFIQGQCLDFTLRSSAIFGSAVGFRARHCRVLQETSVKLLCLSTKRWMKFAISNYFAKSTCWVSRGGLPGLGMSLPRVTYVKIMYVHPQPFSRMKFSWYLQCFLLFSQ